MNSILNDAIAMADIMRVLDHFEDEALQSIELDHQIKCDNYESVGRYRLIKNIRKAIAAAPQTTLKPHLTKSRKERKNDS